MLLHVCNFCGHIMTEPGSTLLVYDAGSACEKFCACAECTDQKILSQLAAKPERDKVSIQELMRKNERWNPTDIKKLLSDVGISLTVSSDDIKYLQRLRFSNATIQKLYDLSDEEFKQYIAVEPVKTTVSLDTAANDYLEGKPATRIAASLRPKKYSKDAVFTYLKENVPESSWRDDLKYYQSSEPKEELPVASQPKEEPPVTPQPKEELLVTLQPAPPASIEVRPTTIKSPISRYEIGVSALTIAREYTAKGHTYNDVYKYLSENIPREKWREDLVEFHDTGTIKDDRKCVSKYNNDIIVAEYRKGVAVETIVKRFRPKGYNMDKVCAALFDVIPKEDWTVELHALKIKQEGFEPQSDEESSKIVEKAKKRIDVPGILALYRAGWGVKAIADDKNYSPALVKKVLEKYVKQKE